MVVGVYTIYMNRDVKTIDKIEAGDCKECKHWITFQYNGRIISKCGALKCPYLEVDQ